LWLAYYLIGRGFHPAYLTGCVRAARTRSFPRRLATAIVKAFDLIEEQAFPLVSVIVEVDFMVG